MKRIIDTELIKELLETEWGYEGIRDDLDNLFLKNGTPIDNATVCDIERQTGEWKNTDEGFSPYECSVCGSIEFKKSNYCPNCGADMRGVKG